MGTRICVVIPYFEAGQSLLQSLESIHLRADDSIIVVDDGSSCMPASEICPSSVNGTPATLITLDENSGIATALKRGIERIPDGVEYVARLDCGDVCSNERFEKQRAFMDQNSDCGVVGSWVEFVNPSGELLYCHRPPITDAEIRTYMRVNCALVHPTVVMRRDAYKNAGGYSNNYPAAEDYALFREILQTHTAHNLDEVLVTCLTSDGGISESSRKAQIRSRIKIMREYNDFHPMSLYGIIRAYVQLVLPNKLTTPVRILGATLRRGRAVR